MGGFGSSNLQDIEVAGGRDGLSVIDVYAVGVEVEKDLAFVADVDGFKVVKILIPSWLR